MSEVEGTLLGRVLSIHRYPLKSMGGEEVEEAFVTELGLLGDRAYALVDAETGKVASAKNPRKWPGVLDFQASFLEAPGGSGAMPGARVTAPGGEVLSTEDGDFDRKISGLLHREVRLARSAFPGAGAEGYWPDHEWLPEEAGVFEFEFPAGTFFDGAPIHLLTSATLEYLKALAPESRWDVPRFRPNFVVEAAGGAAGFVENGWIGKTLAIGESLIEVWRPCPRCVMTTLEQAGLPKDSEVLRTAVRNNKGNVGVYCRVVRAGRVKRGDEVAVV